MPWGRLDDRANSDAKLLALSDPAWRMWGCGIIYCQFNLTDGFIPDHAIHAFGVRARNKEAVADELCRSLVPGKGSLWERVAGGYQVHDYAEWNDLKEKVERQRAASKDRLERFRKRKEKRVSTSVANDAGNVDRTPVQYHGELSKEQESSRRGRARVFEGERLKVSQKQHQVVLDEMGSLAESLNFTQLYVSWDAQLAASGEDFDTLMFIKRRTADAMRALRACGIRRVDDDAQGLRAERSADDERRRAEEVDQVDELWLLVGEATRQQLRALAGSELKAFAMRMPADALAQATEAAARRLLGERFPGRDRKRAELARLRESAVVA